MKPIISVRNLSKKYIIGENIHGRGARTFRDIFDYKTKRLFRRGIKRSKEDTTIWALKDVSFDVDQGEVVGIIGRNGAGKSTLLKTLSRITEPTEGEVTLRGRVASLLEVGTGFSGELTGRDNIFLNGSILGMKKKEIRQKFDEIVAFAEVEKFIDTPVKRYSSGMYVRLAFAVAAHLEPEILFIDEVLAVGDAEFQKRCIGKIEEVSQKGRTVLFVSHNMAAIDSLCQSCILLKDGQIKEIGETNRITSLYLKGEDLENSNKLFWESEEDCPGDEYVRLRQLRLIDEKGEDIQNIRVNTRFGIEAQFEVFKRGYRPTPNFFIGTQRGEKVFQSIGNSVNREFCMGKYRSISWIPKNFLNDEKYVIVYALTTLNPVHIHLQVELKFEVGDDLNAITRGDYMGKMHGVARPFLVWETEKITA